MSNICLYVDYYKRQKNTNINNKILKKTKYYGITCTDIIKRKGNKNGRKQPKKRKCKVKSTSK